MAEWQHKCYQLTFSVDFPIEKSWTYFILILAMKIKKYFAKLSLTCLTSMEPKICCVKATAKNYFWSKYKTKKEKRKKKTKDEIPINYFSIYTLAKNHVCFVTFYYFYYW